MKKVISSIYCNVIQNNAWGRFFDKDLASCAVEKLINSQIAPRMIQKEIKNACAKIALDHIMSEMEQQTNQFKVKAKHIFCDKTAGKFQIGFY